LLSPARLMKRARKLESSWAFWYCNFFETTHSFVILAIVEPSSHSESFMALTKVRPVTCASLPFCSSLVSSRTKSKLT
jgi:hypothetical protein